MPAIAELLTKALETLFRRKTVNVAAFANSDGPVSDIPWATSPATASRSTPRSRSTELRLSAS